MNFAPRKKDRTVPFTPPLTPPLVFPFKEPEQKDSGSASEALSLTAPGDRGVRENRQLQPGEPPTGISGERPAVSTRSTVVECCCLPVFSMLLSVELLSDECSQHGSTSQPFITRLCISIIQIGPCSEGCVCVCMFVCHLLNCLLSVHYACGGL